MGKFPNENLFGDLFELQNEHYVSDRGMQAKNLNYLRIKNIIVKIFHIPVLVENQNRCNQLKNPGGFVSATRFIY